MKPPVASLILGAIAAASAVIALSLAFHGTGDAGWLLAAQYTARFAFALFLVAFLGPAWLPGFDDAAERAAILAFGAAHAIHLGALITYRAIAGTIPSASGLVIGGAGYVMLVAMMLLIARGRASRAFRSGVLHYLAVVFLLTYATKIPTGDQHGAGVMGTSACVIAFGLRHARRWVPSRN